MQAELPRIAAVSVTDQNTLRITWIGGDSAIVDLTGWIATGGPLLEPLKDPAVFARAAVADWGAAVAWNDDDDLAIDSFHLQKLSDLQKPVEPSAWQAHLGLSNNEAADLLGVSRSTWLGYKASRKIPAGHAITLAATLNDRTLFQALYRPRQAGRPRKIKHSMGR